ncbi:MAG TPA: hypothetical protein DD416_02790 [Rhodobacteraceae bacterium]|jgi:hypothetical protein|nr:hypothetical protein [Paracoccaceae bacterium]
MIFAPEKLPRASKRFGGEISQLNAQYNHKPEPERQKRRAGWVITALAMPSEIITHTPICAIVPLTSGAYTATQKRLDLALYEG